MAWVYLLLAGACEMIWPLGFKYTHGFKTHYGWVAVTMCMMILSFWLMGVASTSAQPTRFGRASALRARPSWG